MNRKKDFFEKLTDDELYQYILDRDIFEYYYRKDETQAARYCDRFEEVFGGETYISTMDEEINYEIIRRFMLNLRKTYIEVEHPATDDFTLAVNDTDKLFYVTREKVFLDMLLIAPESEGIKYDLLKFVTFSTLCAKIEQLLESGYNANLRNEFNEEI
jgi:hypothetical protein